MKLTFYPETDSLYIELSSKNSYETVEIKEGVNADFDEDGNIVGLDIDGASNKLDLSILETNSIPTKLIKAA